MWSEESAKIACLEICISQDPYATEKEINPQKIVMRNG